MKRVKIDMEYIFRASPAILYTFITTPECLVRWFCDVVDIQDDTYTFSWGDSDELADMLDDLEEERVRFGWHDNEDEYLEFRMYRSGVTNQTVLEISDFCDDGEQGEQNDYWNNLVQILKKVTGG